MEKHNHWPWTILQLSMFINYLLIGMSSDQCSGKVDQDQDSHESAQFELLLLD